MARIEIESDVTGTVWKIEVEEGSKVTEGQTLIILESMKMEIPVLASDDGTVAAGASWKSVVCGEHEMRRGRHFATFTLRSLRCSK